LDINSNVKMDPSLRWDDGLRISSTSNAPLVEKFLGSLRAPHARLYYAINS
jgi:hypothetical protein